MMSERLDVLENHLIEQGYMSLSSGYDRDFSRDGLRRISEMVRLMWIKNPLIKRAVTVQCLYVWAQGVTIRAVHPTVDAVVQETLSDPSNMTVVGDVEAWTRLETELQLFGNLFFVMFQNPSTGRIKIRTIPFDEVLSIIANPDDAQDAHYYLRVWQSSTYSAQSGISTPTTHKAYYPDWRYTPAGGHPAYIGDIPVVESPVYHISTNRLNDMQFGVSEVYAACDWASAYKSFLEKWVTITDSLAMFASRIIGENKKSVTTAVSKLQEMLPSLQTNLANARDAAGNQVGGTWASTRGATYEPIKTSGMTTGMDDARRLMLMVCSATGINEPYLTGDPSTGNRATATSMERPMELQFTARQGLWRSILTGIVGYIIDAAALAPNGKLANGATVETDDDGDRIVTLGIDPETGEPISKLVEVKFPPILQHNTLEMINAIVSATTLNGGLPAGTIPLKHAARLLLNILGEENSNELVDEWFGDDDGLTTGTDTDSEVALSRAIGKLESYLREVAQ